MNLNLGVVHKWRQGLGGEGVNNFVTSVLSNKIRDDGGGEGDQKIPKNFVTSFMDNAIFVTWKSM